MNAQEPSMLPHDLEPASGSDCSTIVLPFSNKIMEVASKLIYSVLEVSERSGQAEGKG